MADNAHKQEEKHSIKNDLWLVAQLAWSIGWINFAKEQPSGFPLANSPFPQWCGLSVGAHLRHPTLRHSSFVV